MSPIHKGLVARCLLLSTLAAAVGELPAADWQPADGGKRAETGAALYYAKRLAVRPSDGRELSAHLAFFRSPDYRLKVIDLGAGPEPAYPSLADAFRAESCPAGLNGGFFHPDWRPAGLVISEGRRINRFETAKLLSGVLYSDGRGTHLTRPARFQDHPGISALLQTGPYLVENGRRIRGLSASRPDRRAFIATDWRGHWVLGATLSSVSLAELAECLASPGALVPWRIDRAINLDGGSSTGFFFDRGPDRSAVVLKPWKRVRSLIGISPR